MSDAVPPVVVGDRERRPLAEELLERLAAWDHQAWAGWMRHLFSRCYFTPDGAAFMEVPDTQRWQRQMNTPYADLSETEKESDRKEAREILAILEAELGGLRTRCARQQRELEELKKRPAPDVEELLARLDSWADAEPELLNDPAMAMAALQDLADALGELGGLRTRCAHLEKELEDERAKNNARPWRDS